MIRAFPPPLVYDTLGRPTKITPPSGGYTITTYDAAGRPTTQTRYLGTGAGHDTTAITDRSYDDAGHLLTENLPLVRDPATGTMVRPLITHTWDWLDDETQTTDARGKVWTQTYDAFRRLIQTRSPMGVTTTTEYRLRTAPSGGTYQNQVTTYAPPGDPANAQSTATVTTYNVVGWEKTEKVGSLTASTNSYDQYGRMTLGIDAASVRTAFEESASGTQDGIEALSLCRKQGMDWRIMAEERLAAWSAEAPLHVTREQLVGALADSPVVDDSVQMLLRLLGLEPEDEPVSLSLYEGITWPLSGRFSLGKSEVDTDELPYVMGMGKEDAGGAFIGIWKRDVSGPPVARFPQEDMKGAYRELLRLSKGRGKSVRRRQQKR